MIDVLNDLIVIGAVKFHISTLIGWTSGLIGLYANYKQMKRLNKLEDKKDKERFVKDVAEMCYYKIERIAALTPTQLDDKLLSYMKLAFNAYKDKYNEKPSVEEVKTLVNIAEVKASKHKLAKENK